MPRVGKAPPVAGRTTKVYVRRHFVLMSYGFGMFAWNMSFGRALAIVPSYARYHNTTNQVSAPPEFGIDMMTSVDSFTLLFTYMLGAHAVDRWGLRVMVLGNFMICVSAWLWYAAGDSLLFVLLARVLAAFFGPMVSAALLAISNRWYPPQERSKATGVGGLVNVVGAGAALVVSPMFATQSNQVLDLTLKSCDIEGVTGAEAGLPSVMAAWEAAQANGTQIECVDAFLGARDYFCCYLPVDIESLNLAMALVPTATFIFSALSVRNLPPTPPSHAAEPKDSVGLFRGLKMMFSNQRFAKLALSDFIVSGPPLVLYATVSRIFPSEVADYSFLASAAGLALAIPVTLLVAHLLDKSRAYWSYTMGGYASGTVFWVMATISIAAGTNAGAYALLIMVVLAISAYVVWQTAVYETKIEYIFSHTTNLEGYIVGADRVVINLSSLIFVSAIPPESVGGALNTFIIGAVVMIIGCIPTAVIRDRYRYLRQAYDAEFADRSVVQDPEADDASATSNASGANKEAEPTGSMVIQ